MKASLILNIESLYKFFGYAYKSKMPKVGYCQTGIKTNLGLPRFSQAFVCEETGTMNS